MSKSKNKPGNKAKPAAQPKDIKPKGSAYHPTEGAYAEEHPVAKADREEADQFEKDMLHSKQRTEPLDELDEEADQFDKELDQMERDGKLGLKAISEERWLEAQQAEIEAHNRDTRNTREHYVQTYRTYFKYVGLGTNLHGLHVIEIGPAMHPALAICENYSTSGIVEPIHSEELFSFVRNKGIGLIDEPLEKIPNHALESIRSTWGGTIEVWLFNVMQHVIDPDTFIAKCKLVADRIRFFEPIDTPVAPHHPHSYTYDDYLEYFGGVCKKYQGGTEPGFHTADCIYGVWIRE